MAGPGGDLNVDQSTVETEAANVLSAAGHFTAESLSSVDGISTIGANIRGLGVSFMEFDQAMSTLNQQG